MISLFKGNVIHKVESSKGTKSTSQSNGCIAKDEGYQSTLDCTTSKHAESNLVNMEEYYKTQIDALESELKHQQKLNEEQFYAKNELTDEEKEFEGKGKGVKGTLRRSAT